MATRAKLIELGEKKCRACYVHFGADLAYDLLTETNEEGKVEAAFKEAVDEGLDYYEITKPEEIQRLYNFDADFLPIDGGVDIFINGGRITVNGRID